MFSYISWWYGDALTFLRKTVVVITKKIYHSFSISLLISTLFDPWKRDVLSAENASLDVQFNIWVQNMVSRLVGFMTRSMVIFMGFLMTAVSFIVLSLVWFCWFAMPLIIIFLFANGLRLIANG